MPTKRNDRVTKREANELKARLLNAFREDPNAIAFSADDVLGLLAWEERFFYATIDRCIESYQDPELALLGGLKLQQAVRTRVHNHIKRNFDKERGK